MHQINIFYKQVTWTAHRRGYCPVCGKKGLRQTTIEGTFSPYNRRPDGTPKTLQEVYADVQAEAKEWSKGQFIHRKCEEI